MSTDRRKNAAQWFYSHIFRDEAIDPRPRKAEDALPSLLRAARSLENSGGSGWQSREAVFVKQGKLLAAYEDTFCFTGDVVRYYPTYQSLSNAELRGYFTWRTDLRRGDYRKAPLTFAFLYIYELLNQIGVDDSMDGWWRLKEFARRYGQLDPSVTPYLDRWLTDYAVYYGLDAHLLADTPQVLFDRSITVLENAGTQEAADVLRAVNALSGNYWERSRFYRDHPDDCSRVIRRTLQQMAEHYATRCKKGFAEQYFGPLRAFQTQPFAGAVFLDRQKKRTSEYALDERCTYSCRSGLWTVTRHTAPLRSNAKLRLLMKLVDAVLREEFAYPHPIQYVPDPQWVVKLIRREAQALLAEKQAAEAKKLHLDYSQLARIRAEAAVTQEKLTVEEAEQEQEMPTQAASCPASPPDVPPAALPLNEAEYRLLQSLLYGGDLSWVRAEGHLLSVLVDGINEKLYDTFLDSVLDDTPELVEDYTEALKEMVHP